MINPSSLELRIHSGSQMPQIARLETFHNEFVCFVRVTSEDGAFG